MKISKKQTERLAKATTKKLSLEEIIRKNARTHGLAPDDAVKIASSFMHRYGFKPIRANNTVAMYKADIDDPEKVGFAIANADPPKLHIMNVYALLAAFKNMGFSEAVTIFGEGNKGYGAFFPKYFSDVGEIESSEIPELGELQLTVDLDTFGEEDATT